jgi:hypothetical protein
MDLVRSLRCALWVAAIIVTSSVPASALPIFARRYATSCTTCHIIIPKLNPFGIAFRNNGFRLPLNDEKYVVTPDIALGAPAWKKIWPKAVWPGAIPGLPPIAFRADADTVFTPNQALKVNLNYPSFLSLYFAGPAGDTVSYFGQVVLSGSPTTVDIDRAYIQFRLTPEKPGANWLTFKVGQIDTRAEPFSSSFRRTTSDNFNVSDYRATVNGFALRDRNPGLELWGAVTGPDDRGGLEYAVGIAQGISQSDVNEYGGSRAPGTVASTFNSKDYYWGAAYKFGGLGVVGSRHEKETGDVLHNYEEKSIQFGAFGYNANRPTDTANGPDADSLTRTGAKVDMYYQALNVYGALVVGRDSLTGPSPSRINTSAFFVESDYMVFPWVMPLFRFEKTNFSDGRRNIVALIPAVNLAIRANVRLLIEGRFFNRLNVGSSQRTGVNLGLIRIDFAF